MNIELSFVDGDGAIVRDWEKAEFVETEQGLFLSIDIPEGAELVQIRAGQELS